MWKTVEIYWIFITWSFFIHALIERDKALARVEKKLSTLLESENNEKQRVGGPMRFEFRIQPCEG